MYGHFISKKNHMNESLDCNADLHMNQNISNEMESASLYSKAPYDLASTLSLCRPFYNFSKSSQYFSGNTLFAISQP